MRGRARVGSLVLVCGGVFVLARLFLLYAVGSSLAEAVLLFSLCSSLCWVVLLCFY
jgi:hypothetical protein